MGITQAQLAKLAGVSRGTVDRVLNHRGHVDPLVEKKIRELAKENNYQPNKIGVQLVRMKRPLKIGYIVQSFETPFVRMMTREVESTRPLAKAQGAEIRLMTNIGSSIENQIQSLNALMDEGVDGIAVMAIEHEKVIARLREIARQIPLVLVNRDMLIPEKFCYVGQDGFKAGRAAAGLMNLVLEGKGTVMPFTADINNHSVQDRVNAFCEEIQNLHREINVLPIQDCKDDEVIAAELVAAGLEKHPETTGIYFSGNGETGACNVIRRMGLKGKIHMICHDMIEENIRDIREGIIDFTIDQDVHTQAVKPVEIMIDYLLTDKRPESKYILTDIAYKNIYNID